MWESQVWPESLMPLLSGLHAQGTAQGFHPLVQRQ